MSERLTQVAHSAIARVAAPGAICIDATAGNGHDTVFLANAVGDSGRVFSIDIQADAIRVTRERLIAENRLSRVMLMQACHSDVSALVAQCHHQRIAAVMFNLGYLPNSDKTVITTPATTRSAIIAAQHLLSPGGLISIMSYRGHPGGVDEHNTVAKLVASVPTADFTTEQHTAPGTGPTLWLIRKHVAADGGG